MAELDTMAKAYVNRPYGNSSNSFEIIISNARVLYSNDVCLLLYRKIYAVLQNYFRYYYDCTYCLGYIIK